MSDHNLELTAPTLREGPFVEASQQLSASDNWYISGGSSDGVPGIYAVECAWFNVQCCATVANRTMRFRVYSPATGSYSWVYYKTSNITATQVLNGFLSPVSGLVGIAGYYGDFQWLFEPGSIKIHGDDNKLHIFLNAGVTGDVANCYFKFRYMNRELAMPTPYNKGGPWPI